MKKLLVLATVAAVAIGLVAIARAQTAPYDLIIRNARIIDGSGNPWYRGEIGVRGDTIARVAPSVPGSAARVIDAAGQIVSPGFIDLHSHGGDTIFDVPTADNYIRQGVTTIIAGPDGGSPVPLAPFFTKLDALPKSINIGAFLGQGSVREAVMGLANRKPTGDELNKMRAIVDQGMKDGAFGLSTGLFYVPGNFSSTEEVIELAKVVGRYGGIHISHMRDEAFKVVESVRETIRIGEEGGIPTQVTHHKIVGPKNYGKSVDTLRLIDEARSRGVDAMSDQYPYTASSNSIEASLVPQWAQDGGHEAVLKRLKDPQLRKEIMLETARIIRDERGGGDPKNVVLARCSWDPSLDGKNLAEVTKLRGMEPTLENASEAGMWLVEQGNCQAIYHAISEQDLERIMRHPATMIASDGGIQVFGRSAPHPRSYGTFARVLGVYVRERGTITLEDAIRKMTTLPAQRLHVHDRGLLREGMKADLVVFDPARVRDAATFEKPHQYAEGFSSVIVSGQVVFDGKAMTSSRPGKVLRSSLTAR
ncbi:MAG: D-aminoacylase [Vicinamibacterales bacterium]|nr:D-aminoacylase [Vicinamibacterales bacterium]